MTRRLLELHLATVQMSRDRNLLGQICLRKVLTNCDFLGNLVQGAVTHMDLFRSKLLSASQISLGDKGIKNLRRITVALIEALQSGVFMRELRRKRKSRPGLWRLQVGDALINTSKVALNQQGGRLVEVVEELRRLDHHAVDNLRFNVVQLLGQVGFHKLYILLLQLRCVCGVALIDPPDELRLSVFLGRRLLQEGVGRNGLDKAFQQSSFAEWSFRHGRNCSCISELTLHLHK